MRTRNVKIATSANAGQSNHTFNTVKLAFVAGVGAALASKSNAAPAVPFSAARVAFQRARLPGRDALAHGVVSNSNSCQATSKSTESGLE